jgi:hypothetical protein
MGSGCTLYRNGNCRGGTVWKYYILQYVRAWPPNPVEEWNGFPDNLVFQGERTSQWPILE